MLLLMFVVVRVGVGVVFHPASSEQHRGRRRVAGNPSPNSEPTDDDFFLRSRKCLRKMWVIKFFLCARGGIT